jgi:hypothetical protein
MMIWRVAIVVLAVVAYALACYFTGENLLATWWDEWRLARRSLEELDAACAANPCDSGLVVTLTTIPSRIDSLEPTLKSLLRQTVRPHEIRLCLPEWSEREQCTYLVPAWLRALKSVTLVPCADEGPATKFLATLTATSPDQPVLVVDDDRIYHPRLLEHLAALAPGALKLEAVGLGAAAWRERAADLPIEFCRELSDADLGGVYARSDLCCVPSLGDESFGLVALEALAHGLPIVASKIHGYAERLGGADVGEVPSGDPAALAAALLRLAGDPALHAGCAARARELAATFEWERCTNRLLKIYRGGRDGDSAPFRFLIMDPASARCERR